MNRIIITALLTTILIMGCAGTILWVKYKNITATPPDKIEILSSRLTGTGKLILAEEQVYQEYIKKFERGPARARVLFRWLTNYQYIVNMQSAQFKLERVGNTFVVNCPSIQLNDPSIDISRYKPGIVIEGSIWINEQTLINDELQNFKNISQTAGCELMKNPQIIKLCTDQLKLVVLKIASGLKIQVDEVDIKFSEDKQVSINRMI